ncbi:MAG: hypothetical protein H0W67_02320 [Gemmatimonadales bacterium]|nr:hypothetical protein [Gemmatimonadales bacterium]
MAAALLLSGCVYYNGMYNTRRLAGSAWKAEREGRVYQASGLWGQVAVRADSVMVRHPTSRWADEAGVLRGIALARLRQCDDAMSLLARTPRSGPRSRIAEEAALALGRCHVRAGQLEAADFAFAPVLGSHDPGRRSQARVEHARVLRSRGRYAEALAALDSLASSGDAVPGAREERLLALAGGGRRAAALAAADSLVRQSDSTRIWDSLLVAVAEADPVVASGVLDIVLLKARVPPIKRARWMLDDGLRLVPRDPARARRRFQQAVRASGGSVGSGEARLQLLRMDLADARTPDDLRRRQGELRGLEDKVAFFGGDIASLSAAVAAVLAADTITAGAPQGDILLFLSGETARDVLSANRLAAALFRRSAVEWPESPYAAKALLAALRLDPAWSDSAQTLLQGRYALNPYVVVLRGMDDPEYSRLEDSLSAFASAAGRAMVPSGARPGARGRRRPDLSDDAEEDDRLLRKRQGRRSGRAPGSRVPETR